MGRQKATPVGLTSPSIERTPRFPRGVPARGGCFVSPAPFKRPESVLVVIYAETGAILRLQRRDPAGFWQSVTGSLEWSETASEAACRELFEETGIRARPYRLRLCHRFPIAGPWRARYAPDVETNREYAFAIRVAAPVPIRLSAEHVRYRWCRPAEARTLAHSPTDRAVLAQLFGGPQEPEVEDWRC